MRKTLKINLCDLVHNYLGVGTYMFPLNISYIAGYARKYAPQEVDVRLFKYPDQFISAYKKDPADIVGFSNYTWNVDINKKISARVKEINPQAIVVFGGPNIDYSPRGYARFFETHPHVDFYVPYQGEKPFIELLKAVEARGLQIDQLRSAPIDGVIFYDVRNRAAVVGNNIPRIKDLDSIPSPYLTGLLDEFFETKLIPIVETNRGCPYTCTFCAQGFSSHNRLDLFSMDRVKEELRYIATKVKNTNILNLADANFGVVERDMEIAEYIAKLSDETQNLKKFNTNWAKNQPKLFEIARILKSSNIIVSLQSLDEQVLMNVNRANIKISVFKDIMDRVNAMGGMSGTEIILGLPGETKESHIRTLRSLFDWDVSYIICYNALLLEGTEMSLLKENGKFNCTTKFRLVDNSFGTYEGRMSFEAEEGIRATSDMTEDEILYFRPVHWLIQFLWNYRFYYGVLKYLRSIGISPLDYILRLIDEAQTNASYQRIQEIFSEFKQEARAEWFDSVDDLKAHYSRPEKFKDLEDGKHGKMNGKYIFKTLIEAMASFNEFLFATAINYSPLCQSKRAVIEDLFKFHFAAILDLTSDWAEVSREKVLTFHYDILGWQNDKYKTDLERFHRPQGIKFRFYLPEKQKQALELLLQQYAHKNKNVTLRKMSEFMDIRDFFYKVEET